MNQQDRSPGVELAAQVRSVRARYDLLSRGQVAILRRCRNADDVALEGTFWRVGGALAQEKKQLAHVVVQFPHASQIRSAADRFSFGRMLRQKLGDSSGGELRIRRLLDSRDRDELDRRLRAILRLACGDGAAVDWGGLGRDILWFFAESDAVRRRWAQDFYAPTRPRSSAAPVADNPSPGETP
jgi:CRISPR type I-E-associated protein CasB/Cse2